MFTHFSPILRRLYLAVNIVNINSILNYYNSGNRVNRIYGLPKNPVFKKNRKSHVHNVHTIQGFPQKIAKKCVYNNNHIICSHLFTPPLCKMTNFFLNAFSSCAVIKLYFCESK